MNCRPAPACAKALREATERWPQRDRASDGACADDRHKALKSDHNPDADWMATAFDIDHDPDHGFDAAMWAERLRERQDPRIKYVIYRGRMFSSYATPTRKAWAWGPYTGPNPHVKHMHVSVVPAFKRSTADWWYEEADLPLTEQEKDEIVSRVVAGLRPIIEDVKVKLTGHVQATNDHLGKRQVEMRDSLKKLISAEVAALRGDLAAKE